MKKLPKALFILILSSATLLATAAFILHQSTPDFQLEIMRLDDFVPLAEIETERTDYGRFIAMVDFSREPSEQGQKEYYGMEIHITNNPQMDRVQIGVTNNLISRMEIWNGEKMLEFRELGFMHKMTWGATQTMSVEFIDPSNTKYPGRSKITMRFYDGTGITGDIGTINVDLTAYGDLSGEKTLSVFAKPLNGDYITAPDFSNLKVWKNRSTTD